MPLGVIVDALAVALGALLGSAVQTRLTQAFRQHLDLILGSCSLVMGISSIVLMRNMPAVIFAVILGSIIGLTLRLGGRITGAAAAAQRALKLPCPDREGLLTAIVLFCASGTGIYGAMVAGISGDHSILLAKAILDFFTAMIFACSLGVIVSIIAIPQFVILLALFLLAGVILPLTTPVMVDDFKACGGIIMLCTGLRITKIKDLPIADMLPAMVLVMPLSRLWSGLMPLLS